MKQLYTNLRVTIYQTPLINMQRIKRKKYTTKENQQNMKGKKTRKKNQRKSSETTTEQVIKWQQIHIYQ